MKSGAGGDPFADDPGEPEAEQSESQSTDDGESETEPPTGRDRSRRDRPDRDPHERRTDPDEGRDESDDEDDEPAEIPWVLRRSRVKEDRDNVHQFFLRDEYSAAEDDVMAAVAEELEIRGKDLKKLDVREAMVATADAEAIAATLSEWGYEYVD
jgi:hypothetical protein